MWLRRLAMCPPLASVRGKPMCVICYGQTGTTDILRQYFTTALSITFTIPLIFTTQNLAYLGYWYRKKRFFSSQCHHMSSQTSWSQNYVF